MYQSIIKLDKAKFQVRWEHPKYYNDAITMDFKPLIEYFDLVGNFVLAHWQAKPWGLRRYGAYDGNSDTYFSFDYFQFKTNDKPSALIQIDENILKLPPSAVVLYDDCKIEKDGSEFKLV